MKIQPLGDRVVVRPLEAESKTKGGILLPENAKEKPQQGEIVAAGKGKTLENGSVSPLEVKVGDKVIFKKYSPDELPGDEDLMVIKEEDILAVIE